MRRLTGNGSDEFGSEEVDDGWLSEGSTTKLDRGTMRGVYFRRVLLFSAGYFAIAFSPVPVIDHSSD